ncbi:MAG: MbnP family protein [Bacteroidia bacterium]
MKKTLLSLIVILLATLKIQAQKDVVLTVKHMLGDQVFAFNELASNDLGQTFEITRIDYYMSQFTIIHDGGLETSVNSDVYILAKGNANVVANLGSYNVDVVEGIKFHIGVEAPTNNGDMTLWPAGHPLAPQAPSMNWGWTAGYRFVALEGKAGVSMNTGFEMHSLFNVNYFSQTIMLDGVNSENEIYINLDADYTEVLRGINVQAGPIDHGVNATDLTVLENFKNYVFSPGSGFSTGIGQLNKQNLIRVYPNPSNGLINVNLNEGFYDDVLLSIYSIDGRLINEVIANSQKNIMLNIESRGIYFVKVQSEANTIGIQKIVVN